MKKNNLYYAIIASLCFIFIVFVGIKNNLITPNDGILYENSLNQKNEVLVVKFVPIKSAGYNAGINIGDIILAVENTQVKNYHELRKNILYKKNIGEMVVYKVKRKDSIFNIPIILGSKRSFTKTTIMTEIVIISTILLLLFVFSLKEKNFYTYSIAIFYAIIIVIYIYSTVTFEKPHIYIYLILSSTFAPVIPLLIGIRLNKIKNTFINILPIILSGIVFLFWFYLYYKWVRDLQKEDLIILFKWIKYFVAYIVIIGFIGLLSIVRFVFMGVKERENIKYIYASLLIFAGFLPYLVLYGIPVAIGKKEILSIDITLVFMYIPLIIFLVYNFLNQRKNENEK